MNFFEHQDQARRQTRWLVVLFILAVLAIIAAIDLALLMAFTCLLVVAATVPLLKLGFALLAAKHLVLLGLGLLGILFVWCDAVRGKVLPALGTPTDIALGALFAAFG